MSRRIALDGVVREFPDDATDAEISAALASSQPAPRAPAPPKPKATPSFLQDVDRGLTGLASTIDLLPYAAERGLRNVFGSKNIDAADAAVKRVTGMKLVGTDGTDNLVSDVKQLNSLPTNPVMDEAGNAFANSKTTAGGLLSALGVVARNPSVIPHILAESAPTLPIGGIGGKIAVKVAAPIVERVALKAGQRAAQLAATSAFGAGMNGTMTLAHVGANVAGQEQANPSAPGTIDGGNVVKAVARTAGELPGSILSGALLPAGSSRFSSPLARLGARVVAQSGVQGTGAIASTVGGNLAVGEPTTAKQVVGAGLSGLVAGPMDLAGSAFHARSAAFDRLVGEFQRRSGGAPDIAAPQQFGSAPHQVDGTVQETPSGMVADEAGLPVDFANHKAAARYAVDNELGGSHELATAAHSDGSTAIVLRRRPAIAAAPETIPRVVNLDGTEHQFPADATDGEIATALKSEPPAANLPAPLPAVDPRAIDGGPVAAAAGVDGARPVDPPVVAPEPPVLHAPDLRPDAGPLADGEHYVTTPAGNRIRSRFEVVDSSTLKPAEGELQNRDRSRDSTDLQVQNIVSRFDPSRLGDAPETDRGAPIVGPDNVVESGNGRMLAINRIHAEPAHAEKAAAYRQYLESQGHSTDGIANPVLIRRRVNDFTPEQRRQFIVDSNKDAKLAMTSVERARSDADGLDADTLALYRGGDVGNAGNADFVKRFNARLTGDELAGQIDEHGQPSQNGIARIENALMARAYENPQVLSKLIEARDNNIRSIGAGMLDNAGAWAQLRAGVKEGHIKPEYDVTPQLVEAARRVSDIRAKGTKVGDALSQTDAFSQIDPLVEGFMRVFYNHELTRAASREAISEAISTYARRASEQTTAPSLFGEAAETSPAKLLADILRERTEHGTGSLLDAAPANDNPDLDTWHAEVKARRLARQGRTQENDDEADGPPQRNEGRDQRVAREAQGEDASAKEGGTAGGGSRGGAAEAGSGLRAAEGADVLQGLNEEPDYSGGRGVALADAYDPIFATASFTNRASLFNGAAEALGIDPDKFTLMPAPRQVQLLSDAIKVKFGITISVDKGMQERFAIDQMLDAYQNLKGMAHVLDLPAQAISLDGLLTVRLQKKGNFLGMFQPGKNVITLPKRSNSFAHEWGHALDFFLLDKMHATGKGASGALRKEGSAIPASVDVPTTVRGAFVELLNSLFFDKAEVAARVMALEAQIAKTDSAKVKAAAQLAIDKLEGGNSQVRDLRTDYYRNAQAVGKGGDYWTSPTEMMARAFEAYVSFKAEEAGLTTEFIGKGDAAYLSDSDKRFALTFPKGEERSIIFAALDTLMGNIADEHMLAGGAAAERPTGTQRRITDHDRTPAAHPRERGIINREITAIKQSLLQTRKRLADRAADDKGFLETAADLNAVIFGSMTGNLRLIQGRSQSRSLQKLIDLLTKQDGKGDRTVARTFAEDVHLQSKRSLNRLSNIQTANKLLNLTPEQDMLLRDLLIGAHDPGAPPADLPRNKILKLASQHPSWENFVKGASAIRHLLDEEFYANQRAGIDLGYTRNGYLARVLDLPKVSHDEPGFLKAAAKVYQLVFDKEFGTDHVALMGDDEKFASFMKLARFLDRAGHNVPSLSAARAALKQFRKLEAAKAKSDDPDAIQARMDALQQDLEDVIGELFDEVRPAYAAERADKWLAKINLGSGEEMNAASPDSKYTKHRELPPEADKIMEKFYLSDPVESVVNYLNMSARRTSYAKRFGNDGAKRAALFEGMAAEGVSRYDQATVSRILDTATGRVRSNLPRSVEKIASGLTAYTQMGLLPRAMLASLAEPFTAGLVTGDAMAGFDLVGKMLSGMIGSPSGRQRFELARAMGIVTDHAGDGIMEARYGQSYADSTRFERLTSRMFARTGLTGLTRAQKTAMVGVGHAYLDNLSQTLAAPGRWTSAEAVKNATALLREMGVRDPEAFAKQMVDRNGMPSVEELDSDFGYDYATAQLRLNTMVVQEPGMMDRPEFAANPVARVFYALQGFTYGYYRNIIKRQIILTREMGKGSKARATFHGGKLFVAAAVAYAIGVTVSTIREAILNPKRFAEMQADGSLYGNMALLGFNRTFSFGAADTAINAAVGLKYRRDLSNVMVGAGPATILQNVGKVVQPITANSRKTNTAEYSAVQGAYGLISPFANFALARVPGGPLVSVAAGVGMAYATSPAARDLAATTIAGPKNGSTPVGGKKVKSGGTAWDRMLDSAFGKIEPKKKAHATADSYSH